MREGRGRVRERERDRERQRDRERERERDNNYLLATNKVFCIQWNLSILDTFGTV